MIAQSKPNVAFSVSEDQLKALTDRHVQAAVMLQAAFGLRREEAMKFMPKDGIKTDCLRLKGSWTKGGRPRTIPITSVHQRNVLAAIGRVAGNGSLIPKIAAMCSTCGFMSARHIRQGCAVLTVCAINTRKHVMKSSPA